MKRDIQNEADIQEIVTAFYDIAMADPMIGMFFTKVVKLELNIHIPRIISFWSSLLLGKVNYQGNPMVKHIELHRKEKLRLEHFERWLELWSQTIDQFYFGPIAELAKTKAYQISLLMQHKIKNDEMTS